MKISAIVVTYNGIKWIEKCLNSLQTSEVPITTIVIDNGSSDGTTKKINELYPNIEVVVLEKNIGFGAANNVGIKKALDKAADFFLLLNQDAWIEQNTISAILDVYKEHPAYDLISPIHLNGDGKQLDYNFSTYIDPKNCPGFISDVFLDNVKNKFYEIKFVNAACWLLTRRCVEIVGGFNPLLFHYGEDNNYIDRLHYHNLKAAIYPNAKIFHDRTQVNNEKYFEADEILQRSKLLKFLDPSQQGSIQEEIDFKTKQFFYHLASLKIRRSIIDFRERTALIKNWPQYKINIQQSSQKGRTFLST